MKIFDDLKPGESIAIPGEAQHAIIVYCADDFPGLDITPELWKRIRAERERLGRMLFDDDLSRLLAQRGENCDH